MLVKATLDIILACAVLQNAISIDTPFTIKVLLEIEPNLMQRIKWIPILHGIDSHGNFPDYTTC